MVCNKCGQQNNEGALFCYSCGSMLEATQSQQTYDRQMSDQGNVSQTPQQGGINYNNAQGSSFATYDAPAATASVYTAPEAPAPAYTAPASSVPGYTPSGAPSAPAYANPPVYPTSGTQGASSANPGLGMAIAGMICGICSILSLYIGMIPGALGIIFGAVAKNNGSENPMATAGIICGAIGTFLSLIWVVICAIAIS